MTAITRRGALRSGALALTALVVAQPTPVAAEVQSPDFLADWLARHPEAAAPLERLARELERSDPEQAVRFAGLLITLANLIGA